MTQDVKTQAARPVSPRERIQIVDILRGFALFGVLLMNIGGFSGREQLSDYVGVVDRSVILGGAFLAQAKFYTLFSLLFGWGMAFQMLRAEARDGRFLPTYLRRIFILLVMGVLHGVFLWHGDILTTYALLGLLLLLFRRRSDRFVLGTAVLLLLLNVLWYLPVEWVINLRLRYQEWSAFMRWESQPMAAYVQGSYRDVILRQAQDFVRGLSGFPYWFGSVFSMFLLGLVVGRRQIVEELTTSHGRDRIGAQASRLHAAEKTHRLSANETFALQRREEPQPLLHRVLWPGLIIGLIGNGLYAVTVRWPAGGGWLAWLPQNFHQFVGTGGRLIGAPALMLFYVTVIILLYCRTGWQQRLESLAPLGRMALTNYVGQSVICSLIFYGYGLSLYGKLGPTFDLILVVLIYLAQMRFSGWWLARFRFGPLEWAWRSLTYGRRQPLRRGETLAEGRPFSWKQWAGVGLLVMGLVGWYGWRNLRPDDGVTDFLPLVGAVEVQATATPIVPVLTPSPMVAPTATPTIIPPAVEPAAYNPDPLIANGDWGALAASFDVDAALKTIDTLSGPPFDGRAAGTAGGQAAGDYIARQFAQLGLQPGGEDGSYFQEFPIHQTRLDAPPRLVVETAAGPTDDYIPFHDFAPVIRAYMGPGQVAGDVVWANQCLPNDFAGLDAVGKVVLCRGDWPRLEHGRNVLEHGGVALLLLPGPDAFSIDFSPTYYDTWLPEALSVPTFRISEAVAADLVAGSGKSLADLTITFTSFPLDSHARLEISAAAPPICTAAGCAARNVLGVLPGRNPALAGELVIIGAHYDHLGQSPDGVTWAGANDNASGVAAMLEIARSWQAAGYVPQRTVLFAAWDAEELGLLGSRRYLDNPRFPLSDTVGVINLDMVGAGEETLYIDGNGLEEQMTAVAATLGITTTLSSIGRSDHAPFLEAGIPANMLIWFGGADTVPSYHRPSDTTAVIEPEKLAAIGQIAGLTALSLAEAEPQLNELLARRAAAIAENDLAAFLQTSTLRQQGADAAWFSDVQTLAPISATLTAGDIRLLGNTAVANTQLELIYPETGDGNPITRTLSVPLPARFQSGPDGWQWAGADLATAERGEDELFSISYPASADAAAVAGAAQFVSQQYVRMAALLGLPAEVDARLNLYPTADALRADTALSLPQGTNSWVGPGLVKLVYSGPITSHQQLTASLSQLLLAEAGVTEASAPWLWRGLADALAADSDLATIHRAHLPALTAAFADGEWEGSPSAGWAADADWAAVDYLQRQVGWNGLGQFIVDVGQNGLDAALQSALGVDAAGFAAAWTADWRSRLAGAESAVNAVLAARTDAVLAGDRAAFLRLVDPSFSLFLDEEGDWFDRMARTPPDSFALTGHVQVLFDDGRILVTVTQVANPGGTSQRDILFVPGDEGLRWAGPPTETLVGDSITVLYPPGQLEAAQQFLANAETWAARLPDYLTTGLSDHLTIRLSDQPSVLALIRGQLARLGVTDGWLLEGTAVYLAAKIDRQIERETAANLHNLWLGVENGRIGGVAAISEISQTGNEKARGLARTQAWDAVRYLAQTYGEEALAAVLRTQAGGQPVDAALQSVTGQTLAEFDAAWEEALRLNHAQPAWLETANRFDAAQAGQHIAALTAPALAGRQAGSPGAQMAAAYIASQFAAYGLAPVPTNTMAITAAEPVTETAVIPEMSYFQTFTIAYASLTAVPRLEMGDESFDYRRDFLTLLNEVPAGGLAAGALVWVQEETYLGMDLSGKIVVRKPTGAVMDEMTAAMEHGAVGLILVGESDYEKDFQRKRPLPIDFPDEAAIPTLLLTQIGLERLIDMLGMSRADLNSLPPALPLDLPVALDVPLSQPETVDTANVLGYLPGSDPDLRDEVIIVSAHYDHVGDDPGGLAYSGANDNASGLAVLLEMARLWQETGYRPSRSILFAAWGAQEPGNIGSSYYLAHPTLPLTNTAGVIVLDAVGGGAGHRLMAQGVWERDGLMLFGMERADGVLDGRLRVNLPAGQSDDVAFRAAGLPTMLLTWTDATEENWPDPLADEVDLGDLGISGRMAALAVMTIAR